MTRPLTPDQRLENAAFLRQLRLTGNAREAARRVGRAYGTMQNRRSAHRSFASEWDAALAFSQARLARGGGARRPGGSGSAAGAANGDAHPGAHRTRGGEAVVIRRADGTLQMRRAQPGKLTRQAEQAFLLALSATANVRLSAAAAGAAEAAFYRRKRQNPAFAREWQAALALGYDRLEEALIESMSPRSGDDAGWRGNEPPDLPPLTANQMLQLMYLHQKEARLWDERPYMTTRAGESGDAKSGRIAAVYINELARGAEDATTAKVLRDTARRIDPRVEEPLLALVDLAQAKSRRTRRAPARSETAPARPADGTADPTDDAGFTPASGPRVWDESRALFGGWRLEEMEAELRRRVEIASRQSD